MPPRPNTPDIFTADIDLLRPSVLLDSFTLGALRVINEAHRVGVTQVTDAPLTLTHFLDEISSTLRPGPQNEVLTELARKAELLHALHEQSPVISRHPLVRGVEVIIDRSGGAMYTRSLYW